MTGECASISKKKKKTYLNTKNYFYFLWVNIRTLSRYLQKLTKKKIYKQNFHVIKWKDQKIFDVKKVFYPYFRALEILIKYLIFLVSTLAINTYCKFEHLSALKIPLIWTFLQKSDLKYQIFRIIQKFIKLFLKHFFSKILVKIYFLFTSVKSFNSIQFFYILLNDLDKYLENLNYQSFWLNTPPSYRNSAIHHKIKMP